MSRIARWTIALVIALLALTVSLGSAFAEPTYPPLPTPLPTPVATPVHPPVDTSTLEQAYQLAQQQLKEQEAHLKQAGTYAGAVQEMILRLKANHQDTAPLERALVAYRARLAAAQHEWEIAREILRAHLGFDALGKVTNADQARATVAAARSHMANVASILRAAYSELSAALAAYRNTHHSGTMPQPPSVR
jgi:hypothetical protein